MPSQFTLPPDTRSVGSGNPPADMNGVVDALTAAGIAGNVLNAANSGGADPTGGADSSAAIGAAITAAGVNGTVYFPPGTYTAAGLAPLSGQLWYGTATIKRPAASTASVVTATGITGFTMRDLTVDGNSGSSATSNAAIYLINCTGCVLTDVTVQNTPSANAGIILRGAVRCLVNACILTGVGYGVLVGLNHGDAYSCYGNIIRGCTIDTTVNDAIFLTENLGSVGSVTVTGSVVGTVVSGCTVRNFGDQGVEIGSGSVYTEVSGCTFVGISNGAGNGGILFRDAAHSSVTGCTVSNLTKAGSTGVYMFNLNGSNSHNSINDVDVYNCGFGYVVTGGTAISTIGTAAADIAINGGIIDTTGIDGIHLNNVSGFSITGTQVRAAGFQGISIGGFGLSGSGCQDGTITGCRVFNSSQIGTGDSGIILFQATADVVISGCRIGDNQGTKTQKYGISVFDSTVTNVTIDGNDLTGNLTADVHNSSSIANGVLYAPNDPSFMAADAGFLAWSFDPAVVSNASVTTTGIVNLIRVNLRVPAVVTNVIVGITTAGATLTASENFAGLYAGQTAGAYTAGQLIGTSADQSSLWTSTGLKTMALAGGPFTVPAGFYWVAILATGTTIPAFDRCANALNGPSVNAGFAAASARFATVTGVQTSLPAPITPSSNNLSGTAYWAAVS